MSWDKFRLIKVSNKEFPVNLIQIDSYDVSPEQYQDTDSYVDANGELQRTILPHKRTAISFKTRPNLTESKMAQIREVVNLTTRQKCSVEYWNPNKGQFSTGNFYIANPKYRIIRIDESGPIYGEMQIDLVEY